MRQCLYCKEKYGWTEEPTLNCELTGHRIEDPERDEQERLKRQRERDRALPRKRIDMRSGRAREYVVREYVPPSVMPKGFYTAFELAGIWGVSESLIARWCRQDRFVGAFCSSTNRTGAKWNIPVSTERPPRNQTKHKGVANA